MAKTSKTSTTGKKTASKSGAAKAKPGKPAARPSARKPAAKAPAKKAAATKPAKAEPVKGGKATPAAASTAAASAAAAAGKKVPPKGITVVTPKPMKKPKPKKLEMPASEPLFKPGGPKWKPLIPSGPKAPPTGLVGGANETPVEISSKVKLSKKELDKYRGILIQKRAELVGDISHMEDEALRGNSGSLSTLPQHMAEQGSDTFDQSLSLDLAQVDRNLIREIDDALQRIERGTYGVCLRTGQRISAERLAELPWAKYSIEAQREMERRPYHRD